MDSRVEEHARIIVDHSIDVQAGDEVLLSAGSLSEALGTCERGAMARHDQRECLGTCERRAVASREQ